MLRRTKTSLGPSSLLPIFIFLSRVSDKSLASSPERNPVHRYNPTSDPLSYHRRRHKVKHKKKHKEERKHKVAMAPQTNGNEVQVQVEVEGGGEGEGAEDQQKWNVLPGDSYTAIKEQCLKQKLSISLKRLNTNAYARCDYPVSNASSGCKSPGASSDDLSEQEPEVDAGETAPDFPPLVMRLAATPVAHCLTATGRRMDVGDVVWGKIHGFPWWPGKVMYHNIVFVISILAYRDRVSTTWSVTH